MKGFGIALSFLLLVSCSWAVDNIAIQLAQLNYQFLLVPLSGRNASTADPTPNGLATGGARSIFLLHSCMYDAWAAYQPAANYSHSGNGISKTTGDATTIATSIAYAGYTAIRYIWGSSQNYVNQVRTVMSNNGYDPDDFNNNTNNAAGIGNRACYNILIQRQRDGYNEQGDETLSFNYGAPWSDYTNFKTVNPPQAQPIDCSQLRSQTAWVPLILPTGTQKFSSIHMIKVKPFAISSPFEFTIPGPNLPGTSTEARFFVELDNVTNFSANLNDATKMSSEYWARSSGAALWEGITIQSARNAGLSLDNTIKLFFAEGIGAYDAGISCWSHKRIFESMRPNSAVACFKSGNITAWRGPYLGTGTIRPVDFQSFLVMPNFSEYPSGHSTWSGAASVVLRNFFGGNDTFRGDPVFIAEGTSVVEPKITSGNTGYIAGVTDVPNTGAGTPGYSPATNMTLTWATFSEAQNDAGISRLYGGFHFTAGDEDAKALGRLIGQKAWTVAQSYWQGTVPAPVNPNNTPTNTYTTVPQGTPDNVAIRFAQLNYNFLLKPLGSGGNIDDSPNGLATGGARSLFILGSCFFDAWAVYKVNVTSSHSNSLNKKPNLDTPANVAKSIAFAGYTALSRFWRSYPTEISQINGLLTSLGYSLTEINSTDANTPQGIGYLACKNVIEYRANDGYNELGNSPYTKIPTASWKDYTNFKTQNDAQFQSTTNCSALNNIYGWMPLKLSNTTSQPFSSIQMMGVRPFSLNGPFDYPMNGPNMPNTPRQAAFLNELNNLISYSGNLNDTLKMIAEFWASSSGGALWGGITIQAARNARLSLEDTVKLFFAEGVGSYDAGITCWSYKRIYQNMRPNTAIQCFGPLTFNGWLGPYNGAGLISRSQFQPYMTTPPFAEYPSGHSTWSGAAAVVLKNFFGDDTFRGDPVVIAEGTSVVEPKITAGNPGYIAGVTDVPNTGAGTPGYSPAANVTLRWSTWTEAQNEAGISRVYGGWHPIAGNIDATAIGRLVGQKAWMVAQSHWINQQPTPTATTGTITTTTTTGDLDSTSVSEGITTFVSFILLVVALVL